MSLGTKNELILEQIFKIIAPGEPLRNAIEKIQEASLGALLVLSSIDSMEDYIDGGFELNTNFSPQKVYELAKMDGAVLISEDLKTIYGANIQLQAGKNVDTDESGTRHRTADKIAKLTNKIVVTISERRKKITVFKGDFKYSLEPIGDLLIKSTQALNSLEKYSSSVNNFFTDLTISELESTVILDELINGLRYFYLMFTMDKEVKQYIMELGIEGRLLELQYYEVMANQKQYFNNFIRDYSAKSKKNLEKTFNDLMMLEKDELRDDDKLAKILGYDLKLVQLEENLIPKGYRLVSKVKKLNKKDVENIVSTFGNLNNILNATYDEIFSIKGMGKFKTERLLKIKETTSIF